MTDLTPFLTAARWFGGKSRPARITAVTRLGVLSAPDAVPGVAIDLATVEYDDTEGGTQWYQLPLAFYPELQDRLGHALVGSWDDADFGPSFAYDAVHDRDAMANWLSAFDRSETGPVITFHRLAEADHQLDLSTHSTLFSGEQSNSSVAFGEDALLKIFRRVTPGLNPDIEIHRTLTRAGSDHVAALFGWVDASTADGPIQLAMLQQFLRTASDGWELALASVRNLFAEADLHADEVGGDFAGEAARLGTAVAEVHQTLRETMPTGVLDAAATAEAMRVRLDAALVVVPDLAEHAQQLRAAYDALAALPHSPTQQIHGDLHLGQTLRTVKGWKLVDFEGEPARPLAERMSPDSPWRDVAGMLRSFDYAPRVTERTFADADPDEEAQRHFRADEWAARNRAAFLDDYAGRELSADEETLLAAYLADKVVYEAVYETRNRPSWVSIPLEALSRWGVA